MSLAGDEIHALIADIGTSTARFGYSGEDRPKLVIPSHVVESIPKSPDVPDAKRKRRGGGRNSSASSTKASKSSPSLLFGNNPGSVTSSPREIVPLFDVTYSATSRESPQVKNWDAYEKFWEYSIGQLLPPNDQVSQWPILFSSPDMINLGASGSSGVHPSARLFEFLFESIQTPAIFTFPESALASFATGKYNTLMCTMGHSGSRVVPLFDGIPLKSSSEQTPIGGKILSDILVKIMTEKYKSTYAKETIPLHVDIRKRATAAGGGNDDQLLSLRPSHRAWLTQITIYNDIKHHYTQMPFMKYQPDLAQKIASVPYELPDGTSLQLANERYAIPELLVNPNLNAGLLADRSDKDFFKETLSALLAQSRSGKSNDSSSGGKQQLLSVEDIKGVPEIIADSIQKVDVDLRRTLIQNIVLSGGSSCFPFVQKRFQAELASLLPLTLKSKVISPEKTVRQFDTWLGGSVVSVLGSFQQMWFSKAQYEEQGVDYFFNNQQF
eukprot:g3665.t1